MYKASKIDFISLDYIDMYKLLLEGRIASFPSRFWADRNPAEAREIAIKLLRYLIDEKLKFCDEDIKREVCKKFLTKYKLHTASKLFGRSAVRYTIAAFPSRKLKPWQFKQDKVPISYWAKEENRISAIKYVIEEELKWSVKDIKEKLDWQILNERGLSSIHAYCSGLYELVNAIYPNTFKEWELQNTSVPNYFWDKKVNREKAIRWLVKEKLKLKPSEALIKLERAHFSQYGLTTLFCNYYNYSVKRAVNDTFKLGKK